MNDVIALLNAHRSVRKYKASDVPDEHVCAAVAAGQAASTSSAIQAYCVIQVTAPESRRELAKLTGPQKHVGDAGAFFVICGDSRRHRLACADHGRKYDARFEAFLLASIDASLFAQNMVIAFESLGYGVCYIGGLRTRINEIDRLLQIPEGVYPLFGLCVGVPDERPEPRPRLPIEAVLFKDRYPSDEAMQDLMVEYDEAYRSYLRQRSAGKESIARAWASRMGEKFSEPRRPHVGAYYTRKGADLS